MTDKTVRRLQAMALDLTIELRAAAMAGVRVRVETIERKDALNPHGPEYTEIQINPVEGSNEPD